MVNSNFYCLNIETQEVSKKLRLKIRRSVLSQTYSNSSHNKDVFSDQNIEVIVDKFVQ